MAESIRRDVFQAIADPTRRRIIALLAANAMSLNAIAENFDISRPAVSQQIKILKECGIISIEPNGRERICRINPGGLRELAEWADQYRTLWEEKLDSFEEYLFQLKLKRQKNE